MIDSHCVLLCLHWSVSQNFWNFFKKEARRSLIQNTLSRIIYNYQPISESIHKVWTIFWALVFCKHPYFDSINSNWLYKENLFNFQILKGPEMGGSSKFFLKIPKTPLRNRKCHPELLGGRFQDNLKIDIFQQNWTQLTK